MSSQFMLLIRDIAQHFPQISVNLSRFPISFLLKLLPITRIVSKYPGEDRILSNIVETTTGEFVHHHEEFHV